MENKSHAIAAGLFTLVLGLALGLTAMWLNRDTTQRMPYELVTNGSVSGLLPQASVRFRGLEVGKVDTIQFDPKHSGQILVRVDVDTATPISRSTFAELGYQGVTGIAYVQLDDDGKNPTPLTSSSDQIARIAIHPGLLDRLSTHGEDIVTHLDETVTRLNSILSVQNEKALTDTLTAATSTAHKVGDLASSAQPTLAQLPKTLAQADHSLAQLDGLANDYSALAQKIQNTNGLLDHLASSLDRFDATAKTLTDGTLPRIGTLSDDAARSARSATRTFDHVSNQPQSLIFGAAPKDPGPGEPGFVSPK